jgi:hypothetical protein
LGKVVIGCKQVETSVKLTKSKSHYDTGQPRDDHGRWATTNSSKQKFKNALDSATKKLKIKLSKPEGENLEDEEGNSAFLYDHNKKGLIHFPSLQYENLSSRATVLRKASVLKKALITNKERDSYKELAKKEGFYEGVTHNQLEDIAKKAIKEIPNAPPPYVGDALALAGYTNSRDAVLNGALRYGRMNKELLNEKSLVDKTLKSLPVHEGKTHRGMFLPEEKLHLLDQYKKGLIIEEKGYLSTSSNRNIGDSFIEIVLAHLQREARKKIAQDEPDYLGKRNQISEDIANKGMRVKFTIEAKSARKIENISFHPHEKEVLFPAGSKFEVMDILDEAMSNGEFGKRRKEYPLKHIVMREI